MLATIAACHPAFAQDVTVPQATLNKCAEVADKYKAALDTIDALKIQVAAMSQAIADRDAKISKMAALGDIDTVMEAKLRAMAQDLRDEIKDYEDEVAHLKKQLLQGKSRTDKILGILKVGYYILAGAAIVIGL